MGINFESHSRMQSIKRSNGIFIVVALSSESGVAHFGNFSETVGAVEIH
jgi:hypothetical protein